jgi:hypothetical protein
MGDVFWYLIFWYLIVGPAVSVFVISFYFVRQLEKEINETEKTVKKLGKWRELKNENNNL